MHNVITHLFLYDFHIWFSGRQVGTFSPLYKTFECQQEQKIKENTKETSLAFEKARISY
jgi:hypothetical protein